MYSNYITLYEWLSYGDLGNGVARSGVSCLSDNWLGHTIWHIATTQFTIIIVDIYLIIILNKGVKLLLWLI